MNKPEKTVALCAGCRDDFYNDHNPYGVKQCWSFESAIIEKRIIVGMCQNPPYHQKPKWCMSCYKPTGSCAVKPEALTKEGFWKS